jgi:hypothetical protein
MPMTGNPSSHDHVTHLHSKTCVCVSVCKFSEHSLPSSNKKRKKQHGRETADFWGSLCCGEKEILS